LNRLLIASLNRFGPLGDADRDYLLMCSQTITPFEAGQRIFGAGERSRLRLLARGLAVKQRLLADGGRQIFGIAVPGDLIDLCALFVGADHEVVALGACEVRAMSAREVRSMVRDQPSLLAVLCRAVLTEAQTQRHWMVGLGRRTAPARTANLLCEIYWRQNTLQLAQDGRCAFPVVQSDIADALGLSLVHTHRVLRTLREEGLAMVRHGVLEIQDWDRLAALGAFHPDDLRPHQDLADRLAAPRSTRARV